jgi:hypothetical protein
MKNNPVKTVLTLFFLLIVISISGQIQLIPLTGVPVTQTGDTMKNAWAGGFNSPQFSAIDLNGDGIKDLVAFERNFYGVIKTFINEGIPGEVSSVMNPDTGGFSRGCRTGLCWLITMAMEKRISSPRFPPE